MFKRPRPSKITYVRPSTYYFFQGLKWLALPGAILSCYEFSVPLALYLQRQYFAAALTPYASVQIALLALPAMPWVLAVIISDSLAIGQRRTKRTKQAKPMAIPTVAGVARPIDRPSLADAFSRLDPTLHALVAEGFVALTAEQRSRLPPAGG